MDANCEPSRILIIDDNKTTRKSLAFMLRDGRYALRLAASGDEALEMLNQQPPDVILLDVVMPGMDGFELCKRIKSNDEWKHIPVILITSLASQEALVRGLAIGADEFLTKPVSNAELKARVRSMLRIKGQFDELKATIQLREDLAHMMAHDIRNPLAIASLHASLIDRKNSDADTRRHVDSIRDQIKALNQLINETLIVAKSSHSELVLNPQPVDVNELIVKLQETFRVMARTYGIDLRICVPAETRPFMLDLSLFRRTLDNLVTNALKYSAPDSQVVVEAAYINDDEGTPRLQIKVKDQGDGVPEEDREKIFERYGIGKSKVGTQQIGMGLAFCRLVVEAHGGVIYVTDNEPHGAVFTIKI